MTETHALIYHDTHRDPDIYIGTLAECQKACRELVYTYLIRHGWASHAESAVILHGILQDDIAAEYAMEYCNDSVEYLTCEIVEVRLAAQSGDYQ